MNATYSVRWALQGLGPASGAVERHDYGYAGYLQVQRGGREPQLEGLQGEQRRRRFRAYGRRCTGTWCMRNLVPSVYTHVSVFVIPAISGDSASGMANEKTSFLWVDVTSSHTLLVSVFRPSICVLVDSPAGVTQGEATLCYR